MNSYKGSKKLLAFSPGWADADILEKTLVGRRDLVNRLEELAIDGAGGPNKHQRLIVGARGSGKTHVLRVLHNRLWGNEELKQHLLIAYLLEDEMGVASYLDFLVRLLRAILRWFPDQKQLADQLEELYDLPFDRQESRAAQLLQQMIGSKDVLIIMENLDITFNKTKGFGLKGQQALRDLVQRHPRFMIFASSQVLAKSVKEPNAPFFSFFKVIHLRRLTLEEAITFLLTMASAYGKTDAVEFLKSAHGRGRMKTIYEFTGGNHRLLVVFYEFLIADSIANLSEQFIQALVPLKPFYQEQMRSLSAQQQKIIQYLSLQRNPCTVKDIARGCLAKQNTISSQMKDLFDKNFVNRMPQGRESYYEITEVLFRICHEAELEQEGARVQLFVDFLANLYTAEELQLRQRRFFLLADRQERESQNSFAEDAAFYSQALSSHYPDVSAQVLEPADDNIESEDEFRSLFKAMENSGAYREIIQIAKHLGDDKDAFVLHTEAIAYAQLGDSEKAANFAREALSKDTEDADAHMILARALSLNPDEKDTALEHAFRARELDPGNPKMLESIGLVFFNNSRYEEAMAQFEVLNKERPDYADGWLLTGQALENLGRMEEAELMYQKSLDLDGKNVKGWIFLSGILESLGENDKAAKAFQEAERLGADMSVLLNSRGEARRMRDQYLLAIDDYEAALKVDPDAVWPQFNIVSSLVALGRVEEALNRLGIAINSDQKSSKPYDANVLQSFHENCLSLFKHAPTASFQSYIDKALDIIRSKEPPYLQRFEESLPLTIFELLKGRKTISEERFSNIVKLFEEVLGKRIEASVSLRFLKTGIEYFKNENKKALLQFSKEERSVFCKKLGIEEYKT